MSTADDLVSLVYVSRAVDTVDDAQLRDILSRSRENNAALGVTGMLLHRDGQFVQILEGASERVHSLVAKIEADSRHTDIRIVLDEPVDHRRFADWTMGFQPIAASSTEPPEGFRDAFDDLDVAAGEGNVSRAVRDISLWFRVRSGAPAVID